MTDMSITEGVLATLHRMIRPGQFTPAPSDALVAAAQAACAAGAEEAARLLWEERAPYVVRGEMIWTHEQLTGVQKPPFPVDRAPSSR